MARGPEQLGGPPWCRAGKRGEEPPSLGDADEPGKLAWRIRTGPSPWLPPRSGSGVGTPITPTEPSAMAPARVKARRWRWPERQRAGWDQRAMPRTAGRLPGERSRGPRCGGARRLRGHPTARSLTGPVTGLNGASTPSAPGGEGAGFISPVGRVGMPRHACSLLGGPGLRVPMALVLLARPPKVGWPPGNPGSSGGSVAWCLPLCSAATRPGLAIATAESTDRPPRPSP